MSKVFIIGNGFDLDLGFKTRYIDFWNSEEFEKYRSTDSGLIKFLNIYANENSTWFDIEALIRNYVVLKEGHGRTRTYVGVVDRDKKQFEYIRTSLAVYLEHQINSQPLNESSYAAQVFKIILEAGFSSIYTFNYTDLYKIAERLSFSHFFDYIDVHGCSSNQSLILGINDSVDVAPNFEFTYKTFSPYYHSVPLKFDLEDADEVVIFGLAMGDIDYPYFQDFFRNLCDPDNNRKNAKLVTIFTFNESSRINILRQLRIMNDKRVSYMFGQNQFQFIRTGVEEDRPKLMHFIQRLQDEINEH